MKKETKKRVRPTIAEVRRLEARIRELEQEEALLALSNKSILETMQMATRYEHMRNLGLFDRVFRWKKILNPLINID